MRAALYDDGDDDDDGEYNDDGCGGDDDDDDYDDGEMMMRRATFTMLIDWHQMIKEINCLKIHLCFFRFYPLFSTSVNKNIMGSHMVASGFMQDRECGFIIFPRHRHRCPRACDGGGTPGLVSAPRLAPI